MSQFDRLPAFPLIANDPYFSIWMPADKPTDTNTVHWTGAEKRIHGYVTVDGRRYSYLGCNSVQAAETLGVHVTPTRTLYEMKAGAVRLDVCFWTPALPKDPDVLSTPITFVDYSVASLDGQAHEVTVRLVMQDQCCYDGMNHPEMYSNSFSVDGLQVCMTGQARQKLLCHSGDHITIDWGYLYAATHQAVEYSRDSLAYTWNLTADTAEKHDYLLLAYDDVASINYFGVPCRAWYARAGRTIVDALRDFDARHDELLQACVALDAAVTEDAEKVGGEDYRLIVTAAWRLTFAAHKLIATPQGEMAFLSKENDSNGCICTVDLSYPSAPILLRYCPELVNAMCRPILAFAELPVWSRDYAPHDLGRYPYATGQVYALRYKLHHGEVVPPVYLYPESADAFDDRYQMPVEESGNMLVLLSAAVRFGASDALARKYLPTLDKWVHYLDEYGEDPGEQLCTDDFAGHLAHNVNLSAKAVVGMACYAELLRHFGDDNGADKWRTRAQEMAQSWLRRADRGDSTPLTFDGQGWSMKYNLVWDLVLDLGLMPRALYERETKSYLPHMNRYGLPLDSRADYTKSDWLCWCAAMAQDAQTRVSLLKPLADYLRETTTRVPFSDWYDTKSGHYVAFIARSVQGGVFMPMLTALKTQEGK